jgi:hypothetical protein
MQSHDPDRMLLPWGLPTMMTAYFALVRATLSLLGSESKLMPRCSPVAHAGDDDDVLLADLEGVHAHRLDVLVKGYMP